MKRILFVDDEPSLLSGLKRSLRPLKNVWDMHFYEGGTEALEALALDPYDVVVSDLRMPKIDGLQLLTEVRRLYPQSLRITLSGSEQELILRAAGIAHQCLLKPCDGEMLKGTLTYACAFHDRLTRIRKAMVDAQMHYSRNAVDVRVVLQAMVDDFARERADVKFVTELSEVPKVRCIREDMLLVATNITTNAVFAVSEVPLERRRITVGCAEVNGAVEIAISDLGVGIPESQRARVFQPFFSTRKIGQGTGQGLSVSRQIVAHEYKGSVEYQSEAGKGSTFKIRWPLNQEAP
jgi:CheY-like chemotaxis protein